MKRFFCDVLAPVRAAKATVSKTTRVVFVVAVMLAFDIVFPDYNSLVSPSRAETVGSGVCRQSVDSTSGVVVTSSGNTCTVRFNSSNTWTAPTGITSINVLVVGGGGGGGGGSLSSSDGDRGSGGGGAGGAINFKSAVSITGGTSFSVTVGAGGSGGNANNANGGWGSSGSAGGQSSLTASGFSTIAASGGNAGTAQVGTNSMTTSGGDGGGTSSTYGSTTNSRSGGQNDYEGGGGGAGAGGNGSNGVDIGGRGGHGGNGGAGYYINPIGTITDYFGGGGGGGATAGDDVNNGSAGSGGAGGGGRGGVNGGSPVAGTANTGGGGGGGGGARMNGSTIVYSAMNGANGGSGTVIVSYTESAPTNTAGSINAAGTEITLTFSEPLSTTTPSVSTFAVTNAGISNPVTNVVVSGSTLVLTLREPVYKDQSLSVTYTDPTIGDDANAVQDNVGLDAATFTRTIATTSVTADVPRAARLIGLGTQTLVNLNTNGGNIRGITSDGNKVYFRLSNDDTKIWEVNLDTIVETPGGTVTVTPTSWSITNPPSATEARQLVYSSGCLFILDASNVLKCIDTATRSASTVNVPSDKAFPAGQGWLTGNIIGFPDGRIGKVGQPGSGGTATTTLLRVYSISGTGANATLSWSEDMTLGDISSAWPSDDHGAVSDGTYLYRIRLIAPVSQAGYKVWRLRSGNESVMAFNGDGTGTCAGSGTMCPVALGLLSNPTYIGRDNYWGRIFVGDFEASRFYMTEGTTEKITVSYNTLGGTSVASGTTVAGATISTAPATPTKAHYTFSGWYTAETGGTEVSFPYTHGRTSSFTLYARWTPNVYTVSYDSQGGSSVNATAWSYGSSLTLPTPTRPGYEFTGWSTTAEGSQLVYQTSNPTRNPNTGAIQYDTENGVFYGRGAGSKAAQLTSQNVAFNRIRYLMEVRYNNVLRYADVSFDAWAGVTISDLAIPDITNQSYIKRNVTNLAVNSNWREQSGFASGVRNGAGKTGRLEIWARNYSMATGGVDLAGDAFSYDSDDTQSDTGSYGSFQVHNVTPGQEQTILAWNEHYSSTPDVGLGSALAGGNSDWTFRRTLGFGTTDWKLKIYVGDLRAGGTTFTPTNTAPFTLYAQWVPTSSTITYNYNNADGGNSRSNNLWTTGDSPITLPSPTRTGFVFGGWYSDSALTTSIGAAGASYTPSGSITAYAKWLRVLNVTFDSRQGSAVSGTTTIEEGSMSSAPATPTRANYDFKGWYTEQTGGTQVTFPYAHGRTSDFTLYAQWITHQSGFSITNAPAQLAYQGNVTLGTTGGNGSGGVVYATSSPSICSVNANTGVVTMLVSSGNCAVVVTKAGDADYYATSATVTIPATKAFQAPISVVGTSSGTYGSSVSLSVSGGTTNGLVSWSDNSSSVCTVNSAGVVSITAGSGGSCTITATMAGDNDYLDAVSSSFAITVSKATQAVLTLTSTETTYGEALTLAATGGSGTGAITWEKVSGNCIVNEAQGIIPDHASNTAGVSCVVRAKRLSDANYLDRFSANTTITIGRASQRGFSITNASTFVTGSSLALTATGGQSSAAVTWSLTSGQCTLTGSTLTASRGGISCVITANKAGDTNFFSTSDSLTVEVEKITQILTFRSTVPSPAVVGSTYTVSVDSSAFLAPTIAVTNQSASVCSVSAGVVTFNAVGTCVVSASQSGNDEYSSAAVSQTINVVATPTDTTPSSGTSNGSTTNNFTSPTTTIAGGNVVTTRTPVAPTTTTTTTTLPPDPSRPQMGANGEAPDVEAGEATAMVQGQAVAVRVERDADSVVLTLPNNVKVRFGRTQPGAETVAIAADGVLRMYPEESVEVVVTGLVPGTTYTIYMFSEPIELGRGEASAEGGVAALARVPKGVSPGDHTIQVNGVGTGGEMVSMSMGFEVLERQDNTLIVVLALSAAVLLALLGGRPIFARRRRTRDSY